MYSSDPKANKENPITPSPLISLHEQLIYKIASLDTAIQQGFRRIDERMDRMQGDLHEHHIEINDRIAKLETDIEKRFLLKRTRIDNVEKRVTDIETWKAVFTARIAAIAGVAVVIWAVVSQPIQQFIGNLF